MVQIESVQIHNADISLAGTLYRPDTDRPAPAMIIIHPASEGCRDAAFFRHLTETLPAAGIATLVYDRRGSGDSGGDFATADFAMLASDAAAAAATLAKHPAIDAQRMGFYGVSQGGWIAPLAAAQYPAAALLVIVSGCGVSPAEQMRYTAQTALHHAGYAAEIIARADALRAQVDAYYRGDVARDAVQAALDGVRDEPWFRLTYLDPTLPVDVRTDKWFYEFAYDPLPAWAAVTQPTLFLFGSTDAYIPIQASVQRYRQATRHRADMTMLQIPGADHLMSHPDADEPAEVSGRVSDDYQHILVTWLQSRFARGDERTTR